MAIQGQGGVPHSDPWPASEGAVTPDAGPVGARAALSVVSQLDAAAVDDERAGLLDASPGSKAVGTSGDGAPDFRTLLREMKVQGWLAGPIAANLLMIGLMGNITLSFAGHYGTQELAAAALAGSLTFMFGRLPLIGLSCALDTLASQAFGAGHHDSLALIFQRTVAFLATHCAGLTVVVASMPLLLRALGWDPELCANVFKYTLATIPSTWLDVLNRPMNRILVAQRVTTPQACISCVATVLHLALNWLFVRGLGLGFVSVAAAQSLTALNVTLMTSGYIYFGNRLYCTWGKGPSSRALKDWQPYAKIAYPACFMECAESWCWGSMSLMAGLLANPAQNVAALSIAFSLFTSMFFVYLSQGLACSTRVGNGLGAGDARQARVSAAAARCWVPLTWLCSAALFTEPHVRRLLVWLYTDGSDEILIRHINNLLWLMVILNLADGTQCVLTGVLQTLANASQGLGRQSFGLRVNLVAFYAVAIPAAVVLAFPLARGVEGLYCGLILGAFVQAAAYATFTARVDWPAEAREAAARVEALRRPAAGSGGAA